MSKAKKTKWYIIEKTAEIFNKQGYAGTSLTDLTSATGLTKGSIYGNFADKEEVAMAAFNHNYQNLIKRFGPVLKDQKTMKAKLLKFLDTYEVLYPELMDLGGCPILNNAVDADDTNKKLSELSEKAFHDWHQNLTGILKQGIDNEEFPSDTPPQFYADLIIVTIEGGLLLAKATGHKHYFNSAIQHLRDLVKADFKMPDYV